MSTLFDLFVSRGKELKFPANQSDRLKSKIVFQPYEIVGASFKFTPAADQFAGEFGGETNASVAARAGLTPIKLNKIEDSKIELFLPLNFDVRDGMRYGQSELGTIGGQALAAASSGLGVSGSVKTTLDELGQSLINLFNVMSGNSDLGALAVARAAQSAGVPQTARDIVGLTGRVIMNPNARTTFGGVEVRTFGFQFNFFPKSEEESENLYYIIRSFRLNAYPEEIPGSSFVPLGYRYPNIFKIRLLSGTGNGLFKNVGTPIKLSYLTDITTSYNRVPGQGLFKNGAPTSITMSLNFREYKALSRQDIKNERNDGFYHYEGKDRVVKDQFRTVGVYS